MINRIEVSDWLAERSQGNQLYARLILDEIVREERDKAGIPEMMMPKSVTLSKFRPGRKKGPK